MLALVVFAAFIGQSPAPPDQKPTPPPVSTPAPATTQAKPTPSPKKGYTVTPVKGDALPAQPPKG